MRKDLRLIFRDRSALIFLFGLPLVFAFLFGTAFGGSGSKANRSPVRVLVANADTGAHGREFIAMMTDMGVAVEPARGGEREVTRRVRSGDRAVGVIVPPDYSAQLERAVNAIAARAPGALNAHLRLLTDPAQAQLAGLAQGAIAGAAQRAAGQMTRKRALELARARYGSLVPDFTEETRTPVTLDVIQPSQAGAQSESPSPGDLVIPGLAVYFVFFTANGVAATLMTERTEGTLRRMLSAPITPGQILLGKMLARGLLGLVQVALLFTVGKMLIHFSLGSSLPGLVLTALATVFAATGLGLLIATFGKTLDQIQGMTTFALLLMGLLSGCLFPRVLLPETVQRLSVITPHAWALNAYQDLLLRHLPLSATLLNIGMVVLFGLVFYGFALARFKYE